MTTTSDTSQGAVEKSDLVNVTIDGIEVAVAKNTLVIRAAEQIGIEIPRFCDHPLLEPVGACRQCLVVQVHRDQAHVPQADQRLRPGAAGPGALRAVRSVHPLLRAGRR
jgi:hypothetical protein